MTAPDSGGNPGMSDQSHFTRSFRRIVGDTPSSWRQARHAAIEERVTELAYPGKAKPIVIEKARQLGRC